MAHQKHWTRKPHATVRVASRESVYAGPFVTVRVPNGADDYDVVVSGQPWKCARYVLPMKGGHIACYAYPAKHTDNIRGKRSVFQVLVYKETLEDGRTFLALHLVEADDEPPTHHFSTHAAEALSERYLGKESVRFAVLPPLIGWIVFTPLARP